MALKVAMFAPRATVLTNAQSVRNPPWGIEYGHIFGKPELPAVWDKLADILNREFQHELGFAMQLDLMAVDLAYRAAKCGALFARTLALSACALSALRVLRP